MSLNAPTASGVWFEGLGLVVSGSFGEVCTN